MPWHCKHYVSRRVMKHFKTGTELAKEMGVSVDTLNDTFTKYNGYAQNPGTDPFGKIYFANVRGIGDSSTSFLVNLRTLRGRRTPPVSSRFGSKLPLPLYADVRTLR